MQYTYAIYIYDSIQETGVLFASKPQKKRYFPNSSDVAYIYHVYAEFNEETKSERINAKSLTGNKLWTIY